MAFHNIYDSRRIWKIAFIIASLILVGIFLYISNNLVKDLASQERDRMEIWANATQELASMSSAEAPVDSLGNPLPGYGAMNTDVDFLLSIIEANHNIPVMLVDNNGNLLLHRNFQLPEAVDSMRPYYISPANKVFLKDKLSELRKTKNQIDIKIDSNITQHLYYEDSTLLKRLYFYPYIQLAVLVVFVLIVYFALISIKKAEQNKVWVGLSKETAHQLGTPISSLMAWLEMLSTTDVEPSIIADMDKDVHRLSVIADRFSKIGSRPEMSLAFINEAVEKSLEYMSSRISSRVELAINSSKDEAGVMLCQPLFEWVMENLTKNAVDAMQGVGKLSVTVSVTTNMVYIDVKDTGKGIARKNFKTVFTPGYTTKKRGWGLGLTLVKRIIEEYHEGRIYVRESELGKGTTFRIELPRLGEE